MDIELEYGDGKVKVTLPDENVDVFETGVTVKYQLDLKLRLK